MRKTVLELDLVAYSDIARVLEESTGPETVASLNDQIQAFVDEALTARQMVIYSLGLLPVSLMPVALGVAGSMYFTAAVLLGLLLPLDLLRLLRLPLPLLLLSLRSTLLGRLLLGLLSTLLRAAFVPPALWPVGLARLVALIIALSVALRVGGYDRS